MANLHTGINIVSNEQITNTKLHKIVNDATISSIKVNELGNELATYSTNASTPDISNANVLLIHYSTYGTLATFVGARVGQRFTLISQQASFPSIIDTGSFKMNGNWIPTKLGDNITLVWDGTNFIEIFRVTV